MTSATPSNFSCASGLLCTVMAGTNTRNTSPEWKNGSRARQLGLNTHIIVDGCRGIELEPGDIDRALEEMKRVGAVLLKSSDL